MKKRTLPHQKLLPETLLRKPDPMSINWASNGFSRATAIFPRLVLGKPLANAAKLIPLLEKESQNGSSVLITPELALTGYTCEDLFHSETLIQETEKALVQIIEASAKCAGLWVIGSPLRLPDGRIFNGAFAINAGKILGFVPKLFLPNMGEFYERRWFVSGRNLHEEVSHPVLGNFYASNEQIFSGGPLRVGIEICQDFWAPVAPSTQLALKGANVLVNLSASNELVGKPSTRRRLVEVQSSKSYCAYLYVSSGTGESSKDTVFSGHTLAYELGKKLGEITPFDESKDTFSVDFDLERILNARSKDICFGEAVDLSGISRVKRTVFAINPAPIKKLERLIETNPFLAEIEDFEEVLAIQAQGLIRRLQSANAQSMILGVSGGLDSTLALLVCLRAKLLAKRPIKIIGVTLPGPGTSEKTLGIARALLAETGVDEVIEVSIKAAVAQHLKDIGKDANDRSVVYENAQARERTQILFDLANEHKGMVVGTGDLSELALGWCTFNADHMAHYAVNSGVPKTIVKLMVNHWVQISDSQKLKETLKEILALPISPELLPPDEKGLISQGTEAILGSYDLHDFFLYYYLSYGFSKEKIRALAREAFRDNEALSSDLDRTLDIFCQRFFTQQFKRTTLPPGPKVHSISLSPRSDFRLPDELSSMS